MLSLSFINHGKFNCYSIVDERSSAYFGLGMTLKSHHPTVLICTSGTALANYLPAIIEASQSKIPMILITADRPVNLLNSGENQTINQKNIYGDFVRKNIHINIDDQYDSIMNTLNKTLKFIDKKNNPNIVSGPIHINVHLDDSINIKSLKKIPYLSDSYKKTRPNEFNWRMLPYEDIFNLYTRKRPLIVIGRLNQKLNKKLLKQLSNHLKAPILADPLSQIRFNNKTSMGFYDHYINNIDMKPDLIIRIGQKPVSKNLSKAIQFWEKKNTNRISFSSLLIDESNRFNDDCPTVVPCKYEDFINVIIKSTSENQNNNFYNYISMLDSKCKAIINDEQEWSELSIAKTCLSSIVNGFSKVRGQPVKGTNDCCGFHPRAN